MSFRWKIILGVTAIQAILLIILIWSGLNVLAQSSEDALLKRARTTAKLFASTAQGAVLATDIAALESIVGEVLSNSGITYARVVTKQGVLAEGGEKSELARKFVEDTSLKSVANDGVFDTYADITVAGEQYGRVEIGISTDSIQLLIAATRTKSFVLAGVNLLLVGLFSFMLGIYLTRGLHALQEGAQHIADGQLGHRITVQGRDELSQTALAFNEMSSKLYQLDEARARKEEEVQNLNSELENRVIERTVQLQDVNKLLSHQALHDSLTSLPNRTLFHDRLSTTLSAANRSKEAFAVIGIDLDLFKEINDTLGHHAGDLVLQHVAAACQTAMRDSDTVARMGGDEFYILLPNVGDHAGAIQVAERVLANIKQPVLISDKHIEIGASLGIAIYPEHGLDDVELINHSDAAMYEAKRCKSGVVVYRPELGEGNNEAVVLKAELRNALIAGEFVLHFQPKIDFQAQKISGVEALVRWQHPRLGLIYPDRFITLAENSGQIKQLTLEVLKLAMQQIHTWRTQGLEFPVAVNISAVNLQDRGFPEIVAAMMAEHEVPSYLLELEVTETAIMTEPLCAIDNIRKLDNIGVLVSIDDFGTGYSSMAYLQKLLVAKIKIDKSFVMDMDKGTKDDVIVRSTIELAHNLGLKAVAEGVESEEVWSKLKAMGCDSAQGYYMSKPLTPAMFTEWLQNSQWSNSVISNLKVVND